jgi:chromate transporter
MSEAATNPAPPAKVPTVLELFVTFALIALYGFGGVLAWSRRMVVEVRGWMTPEEFNDAYALCQFLPGPNIVNFSVVFGSRIRGALGAVVALLGLLGPPMVIVTFFAMLYERYGEIETLQRILAAMAAAAAGLIIGTVVKMAQPLFRGAVTPAPFVVLAVFSAIAIMRWPLPWVLAAMLPVSIALAWWVRR